MAFYRITEKIFQGKRPITGINMLIVAKAFAPSRNNNNNCDYNNSKYIKLII